MMQVDKVRKLAHAEADKMLARGFLNTLILDDFVWAVVEAVGNRNTTESDLLITALNVEFTALRGKRSAVRAQEDTDAN